MARRKQDRIHQKQQAFEQMALPLMDALFRAAWHVTQNEKTAEDLVQETYLKSFKHFSQFKPGSNFKAWMFTILMNNFRNQYRKNAHEPKCIDIDTVSRFFAAQADGDMLVSPDTGEADFDALISDEVKHAMASLPEEYREAALLAFGEGFSYQEIADILEIPVGTVMSRLFRGRQMLKERLADYARSLGYIKRKSGR